MGETTYRPENDLDQKVAYTDSAAVSGPIPGTKVRLFATTDCFVAFGSNPTATSFSMPISGGVPEYFDFIPGELISAIRSASSGNLHITVMAKKVSA